MDKSELIDKIDLILAETLEIDSSIIKPETNLVDDLGADALDLMEIIMRTEIQFSIDLNEYDRCLENNLLTVNDLYVAVEAVLNPK